MVNSNPETVSTDYDTSDRLDFEPLTLEDVLHIFHPKSRARSCSSAARRPESRQPLEQNGVTSSGPARHIDVAEDRQRFQMLVARLQLAPAAEPDGAHRRRSDPARPGRWGIRWW